jgi:Fic family protein
MTRRLVEESGMFRSRPVGVGDQEGNILHFGTLPQYVPGLVSELLEWVKDSNLHMLVRSCVFHYELELIHPFADGNGRIGRLWHTLLLSKWNPAFAWLPVESMIHARQPEYYAAINTSNDAGESTVFIEFMLSTIKASLIDAIDASDGMSDGSMDKATMRWKQIEKYLETHEFIMNADVQGLCGVSAATANRILARLATEGKLNKCRKNGHWAYKLLV